MASQEEIILIRKKKIDILKKLGIDPYPIDIQRDYEINNIISLFDDFLKKNNKINIVGRIRAMRPQGSLIFFEVDDGTAKIQCLLKKDDIGEAGQGFNLFLDVVDVGDFIHVCGTPFVTKRGEKTIKVDTWKMVSKSLRAMPEKWHGLQDIESRLRYRYLDMLFNDDVKNMVMQKSKFWQSVRSFMVNEGFLEVETPILENTTGGADAKPFITHHNALDIDVYLRISCGELWQKKLLIGGLNKVFEIGRIFRNEGMSVEHLQDYTQMEFYWSYANYKDGMQFVERLYRYLAIETFGTTKFNIGNFNVDFSDDWKEYDYAGTIKEMTGVDIFNTNLSDVEYILKKLNVSYEKKGWNLNRAIDNLWKYCRKNIGGPGFLINIPKALSPLAKADFNNPLIAKRFQPIIAGSELGNGYSELNDPIDQSERFNEQIKLREMGDEEAQMCDNDFIEAMEYGMPPACGFGMSERVFSFLSNKPIRETQIFPLVKPLR